MKPAAPILSSAPQLDRSKSPKRLVQEQFARVMVKQLRESLPEDVMGGPFSDAFAGIFDEAMATSLVESGGMDIPWNVPGPAVAWPVPGFDRISSDYGMREAHPVHGDRRMHHGVDIPAPLGSDIHPVREGTVLRVRETEGGYGRLLEIQHEDGMVSRYAHCEAILVSPGDRVDPGQVVALVGNSGDSTGPHLHLEIRVDGEAVDPREHLPLKRREGAEGSDHDHNP